MFGGHSGGMHVHISLINTTDTQATMSGDTIVTVLPQMMEVLHSAGVSAPVYNQISLYNEMIKTALLTGKRKETKASLYGNSKIVLVNNKYLQIEGE